MNEKPIICVADPVNSVLGLAAVRGMWQSQSEVLLDIHVMGMDTDLYCQRPVTAVMKSAD